MLGVAGAITFGAVPAYAAGAPVLPQGQTLYNIDCDNHAPQLWTFTTNGASTPVGSPGEKGSCAGGGQTSPVDGKTYFLLYPGQGSSLATVDLATGAVTTIAALNGPETNAWQFLITNTGAAFISEFDSATSQNALYSIDLTTALTTFVGDMGPVNLGAMGYDFKTDTIYAFDYSKTMGVYTVDRTTGTATNTGITGSWPTATCLGSGNNPGRPDGVAFDANGIAWIQSDSCNSNVMAFDPVSGNSWMTGELFDSTATLYPTGTHAYYSETFLIAPVLSITPAPAPAPAPALASTGADPRAVPLVGISAAIAALLGVVLLTSRRPRKA